MTDMITISEAVPDVEVRTPGPDGPVPVRTGELFGSGRSVLFGVPGAFTPGCSRTHLPGFVEQADDLFAKGVDRIVCVAVNDAFVMEAWATRTTSATRSSCSPTATASSPRRWARRWTRPGSVSATAPSATPRSFDDGTVTQLDVDVSGAVDASACGAVLGRL